MCFYYELKANYMFINFNIIWDFQTDFIHLRQ